MKKILAVLLALAVIGSVAFAQVAITGYERLTITSTNTGAAMANRLRVEMSAKDDNFGMWARLQAADAGGLSPAYAYGWMQIGKMVKVTGGLLGNYDYDLSTGSASDYAATGNVSNDMVILDATTGMLVQFYPVEGLNFGVTMTPVAGKIGLGAFGFNAKYDIKDIGAIIATSWLNDTAADSAASLSFNLTAVKGLDISAGFKYGSGIGYKATAAKEMNVYAIVNFDGGAFTAQFAPEYDLTNNMFYVEGYGQYVAGAFTFRGLAAYDQTKAQLVAGTTYWAGAEVGYTVGKATLFGGFYYDEVTTWKIPVSLKVKF